MSTKREEWIPEKEEEWVNGFGREFRMRQECVCSHSCLIYRDVLASPVGTRVRMENDGRDGR